MCKKFYRDQIFCYIVISEKQGYAAYEILSSRYLFHSVTFLLFVIKLFQKNYVFAILRLINFKSSNHINNSFIKTVMIANFYLTK